MESNGYHLDLTGLVEPVRVKVGEAIYSLPADLPLPLLKRVANAFTSLGDALGSEKEIAEGALEENEERIWRIVEEIMAKATPRPAVPVREMLTVSAVIRLLDFLVTTFNKGLRTEKTETSTAL